MLDNLFKGVFDSDITKTISVDTFLVCLLSSLVIGVVLAGMYMYKSKSSRSFIVSLALLPAVVCVVIMMVNGNVGAGVAVAGAFSLVRFRSAPGSAKEIAAIFIAMGAGLISGMGYIGYSALFTVVLSLANMLLTKVGFSLKKSTADKTMNITIPEDLDYSEIFDDIFSEYTKETELVRVKTTNMGSMFRLTYNLTLKPNANEKEMIDKLRCRNGNLEISMSRQETATAEL